MRKRASKIVKWFGSNVVVIIAGVTAAASLVTALVISRDFHLRMRPYVGVVRIDPAALSEHKNIVRWRTHFKNFGNLPANHVKIQVVVVVDGEEIPVSGITQFAILFPGEPRFTKWSRLDRDLEEAILKKQRIFRLRIRVDYEGAPGTKFFYITERQLDIDRGEWDLIYEKAE